MINKLKTDKEQVHEDLELEGYEEIDESEEAQPKKNVKGEKDNKKDKADGTKVDGEKEAKKAEKENPVKGYPYNEDDEKDSDNSISEQALAIARKAIEKVLAEKAKVSEQDDDDEDDDEEKKVEVDEAKKKKYNEDDDEEDDDDKEVDEGEVPPQFAKNVKKKKDAAEKDDDDEEVDEGEVPPQFAKKKKGDDDDDDEEVDEQNDDDEEDEEEDDETVDEAGGHLTAQQRIAQRKKRKTPAFKLRMKKIAQKKKGKKGFAVRGGKLVKIKPAELRKRSRSAKFSAKTARREGVETHVNAMLEGENLSEAFKEKATTIFEAALQSQVTEIQEVYNQDLERTAGLIAEEVQSDMTEKLNAYLDYVVEEWVKDNKLAIESGIRQEIMESFMADIKKTFEEHNIDMPEDKIDILEEHVKKIEELEDKINEQIDRNIELKSELGDFQRMEIIQDVGTDLADTQLEKLANLSEGINFEDEETFRQKVTTIKESYFSATGPSITDKATIDEDADDAIGDGADDKGTKRRGPMGRYEDALSRQHKI